MPDFSILGEAFKEGDTFKNGNTSSQSDPYDAFTSRNHDKSSSYGGRSRRKGGVKTNLTIIDANGEV